MRRVTWKRGGLRIWACALLVMIPGTVPAGVVVHQLASGPNPYSVGDLTDVALTHVGAVTSQADGVMQADTARNNFGVDGTGIRIGIISDSFDSRVPGASAGIASGDLPGVGNPLGNNTPITIVKDDIGFDEGRVMAELIHDLAPGAELKFHSAFNNTFDPNLPPDQTVADAINNLVASGVDIIVDDVSILTAPRFQDGAAAQAVDAAKAAGVAYFSAAGNSADNATAGTFDGTDGGTVNWGTDDVLLLNFSGNPAGGRIVVQWEEPYATVGGTPTIDFSVDLVDPNNPNNVFLTFDNLSAGQDPFEFVGAIGPAGPVGLRVNHVSGSGTNPVNVQVSTFNDFSIIDVDDMNLPTIYGHQAAEGGLAVGAAFYGTPNQPENFSSLGPTRILFDTLGNPILDIRNTPDLTGIDGVDNTFFPSLLSIFDLEPNGFPNFFGTSAAAPHVAAVAALVLDLANDLGLSLSVDDLYALLLNSTNDITGGNASTGFDNLTGAGLLDALLALQNVQNLVPPPPPNGVVPEPASLAVWSLLTALGLVAYYRRRRG